MSRANVDVKIAVRDGATQMLEAVTEKLFQGQVSSQAKGWGWRVFHDTVAWRSDAGWLDLLMVRGRRLVVVELKTVKMRGLCKPKQREWRMAWWEAGRCDGPYVWDPRCWRQISRVLAPEGVEMLD